MRKIVLLTSISLLFGLHLPASAMLVSNGDFENGDLSGYAVQEDFSDVPSSPLVKNVNDGTGNHVGEINTGFTSNGVTTATLAHDLNTLPPDVQDLIFDIKFMDVGADAPPILTLASAPALNLFSPGAVGQDVLTASLLTDSGDLSPFFAMDVAGFSMINPNQTQVNALPNGFYHVTTDLSGLSSAKNSKLYFDLLDDDDQRLSKVWVDNIDLTKNQAVAPEPASMLLMGAGLFGFGFLRKKKWSKIF